MLYIVEMDNKRRAQKAATREAILHAAAAQFALRGYAGTSFASIAEAMGKPKSAVGYHHFASKQDLASAVVREQRGRWFLLLRVASEAPAGFPRLLRLLLTAAIDARKSDIAAGAINLLTDKSASGLSFPDRPFAWRTYALEQIQAEIEFGSLPPETDALVFTVRFLNASFGVFQAENSGLQEIYTERSLRELWVTLLRGFGVPGAQEIVDGITSFHLAPTSIGLSEAVDDSRYAEL